MTVDARLWKTAPCRSKPAPGRRASEVDLLDSESGRTPEMTTLKGRLLFVIALAAIATAGLTVSAASAQTSLNLCAKKKKPNKGTLALPKGSKCPKGYKALTISTPQGAPGPQGPIGPQGPQG